jgi:hypothetical protein
MLSRVLVTIDGVWFGNFIYWNLTDPWLQIIITLSLIHTVCSSLQHVLSLLSLLCLHQSLPGDGFQECLLLPCSCSYRLATVPQLTHCSKCPANSISAPTAQKTPFLCCCIHCCIRVCWDSNVIANQPLSSTAVVYRANTYQLLLYNCLSRGRCLARGPDVTIYWAEEVSPYRHPMFIISSHMGLCQTIPDVVSSCFRMKILYAFLFSPISAIWTAHFTVLNLSY